MGFQAPIAPGDSFAIPMPNCVSKGAFYNKATRGYVESGEVLPFYVVGASKANNIMERH